MADKMTDIIIIGGGTAGMTAAVYAGRAGRSVKVLEQSIHGGQIINTSHVENFPGFDNIAGFEFATVSIPSVTAFRTSITQRQRRMSRSAFLKDTANS